jgi:hypothetical protein
MYSEHPDYKGHILRKDRWEFQKYKYIFFLS